eukprot:8133000-Alexandrium_andersonii.AAC.1
MARCLSRYALELRQFSSAGSAQGRPYGQVLARAPLLALLGRWGARRKRCKRAVGWGPAAQQNQS